MTISSSFSNSSHTGIVVAVVVIVVVAVALALALAPSPVVVPVIPTGIKSKVAEGNEVHQSSIKRVCKW